MQLIYKWLQKEVFWRVLKEENWIHLYLYITSKISSRKSMKKNTSKEQKKKEQILIFNIEPLSIFITNTWYSNDFIKRRAKLLPSTFFHTNYNEMNRKPHRKKKSHETPYKIWYNNEKKKYFRISINHSLKPKLHLIPTVSTGSMSKKEPICTDFSKTKNSSFII